LAGGGAKYSVWGNWANFIDYTKFINPWFPESFIQVIGVFATLAEIILALCLIVGFKTEFTAKLSGLLLLSFAFAMTLTVGIKSVFDYSVFTAAAASFALSQLKEKYLEIDQLIKRQHEII
jgi:uncharacterized membrane protein YphA (DoxX/SURF4 family)